MYNIVPRGVVVLCHSDLCLSFFRSLVGQFGVICSTDDFFVVSGK